MLDQQKKEEEVEEEVEEASYGAILKLNKSEWPYIVVGCFFAAILGVAMPAFAILFSEVVDVSNHITVTFEIIVKK